MNEFQFNQNPKEKSCGWRCLHYIYPESISYEDFLHKFQELTPCKSGVWFKVICSILGFHGIKYKFVVPKSTGLYLIWSGVWDSAGGHYFVYHDGMMYDSLASGPYSYPLEELLVKLETTNVKDHFVCMQVL